MQNTQQFDTTSSASKSKIDVKGTVDITKSFEKIIESYIKNKSSKNIESLFNKEIAEKLISPLFNQIKNSIEKHDLAVDNNLNFSLLLNEALDSSFKNIKIDSNLIKNANKTINDKISDIIISFEKIDSSLYSKTFNAKILKQIDTATDNIKLNSLFSEKNNNNLFDINSTIEASLNKKLNNLFSNKELIINSIAASQQSQQQEYSSGSNFLDKIINYINDKTYKENPSKNNTRETDKLETNNIERDAEEVGLTDRNFFNLEDKTIENLSKNIGLSIKNLDLINLTEFLKIKDWIEIHTKQINKPLANILKELNNIKDITKQIEININKNNNNIDIPDRFRRNRNNNKNQNKSKSNKSRPVRNKTTAVKNSKTRTTALKRPSLPRVNNNQTSPRRSFFEKATNLTKKLTNPTKPGSKSFLTRAITRARPAATIARSLATLGTFGSTSVAAAGILPIIATVGAGAALGYAGGKMLEPVQKAVMDAGGDAITASYAKKLNQNIHVDTSKKIIDAEAEYLRDKKRISGEEATINKAAYIINKYIDSIKKQGASEADINAIQKYAQEKISADIFNIQVEIPESILAKRIQPLVKKEEVLPSTDELTKKEEVLPLNIESSKAKKEEVLPLNIEPSKAKKEEVLPLNIEPSKAKKEEVLPFNIESLSSKDKKEEVLPYKLREREIKDDVKLDSIKFEPLINFLSPVFANTHNDINSIKNILISIDNKLNNNLINTNTSGNVVNMPVAENYNNNSTPISQRTIYPVPGGSIKNFREQAVNAFNSQTKGILFY